MDRRMARSAEIRVQPDLADGLRKVYEELTERSRAGRGWEEDMPLQVSRPTVVQIHWLIHIDGESSSAHAISS
jgi:hypothetical protein